VHFCKQSRNVLGLPKGQGTASCAYAQHYVGHQWPHEAQLPAEQPAHELCPADALVVWPCSPLLVNPQALMSLWMSSVLQTGQLGLSEPMMSISKSLLHLLQWNS
jgi:hypothetical protein